MTIKTHVKFGRWIIAGAVTIGALIATAKEAQAVRGMSLFLINSLPSTCDVKAGMVGYRLSGGVAHCEVWVTHGATAFTPCAAGVDTFDLKIARDWHNPVATLLRSNSFGWPASGQVTYDGTSPSVTGCNGVTATATGTSNN
jgi:hypothetical protein